MPFYEYECSNCKFYVELLQKISEEPLRKCPSCKKQAMKKLVSAPVFRLKGAGWYETDFKSEGEDKRNLADREEAADKSDDAKPAADTKAEGAADKKPEAKSEVTTGSGNGKKPPAKAEPKAPAKNQPKPAPVRAAAKTGKPAKSAKPSRPAAKKAPAKKKAKRR
jgi:putative FmdB family regulatory protein